MTLQMDRFIETHQEFRAPLPLLSVFFPVHFIPVKFQAATPKIKSTTQTMSDQVEVICLDSDDEVPSTNKENILNHTSAAIKSEGGVKSEQAAVGGGTSIFSQSTNDDDEVEVVDGSDLQSELLTHHAAATTTAAGSDDELEIVGTKNEANYIHNRQNCLVCRYKP